MPLVFLETSELLEAKSQSVSSAAQWILMQLFLEKSLRKAEIRRCHHQVYRPHCPNMLYKVWVLFQRLWLCLLSLSFLSFLIFKVCDFLSFDPKISSHGIFNSPCLPRLTPIPTPLHMWLPSCSICLPLPAREAKGHASCRHGWSSLMCFSGTYTPWSVSCPAGHLITLTS